MRTVPRWMPLATLLACSRADPATSTAASASSTVASAAPVVSAATSAGSQGIAGPASDLNVLLITVDSLRADMPWAGYPRPIAPRLTALEGRAVSYTHAYALSSYTSMSLGGMLGGRYPGEMKRDGYFFGTYHPSNVLFPELAKAAGVRTLAAHAHLYFKKGASGFDQGFDVYELVPKLKWNATTDENVTGADHEKLAETMLGDPTNTSGKFFAWFHFLDPHDQYQKHPDVEPYGSTIRDRYDGEVTFVDRQIGKLLDFVAEKPWGARTAVIVSADHGEVFGEHGMFRHGFELWQPLVRVAWMFLLPGVAPRRIDASRSHLDMAPTVLDLLGVVHGPMEGKSLVPELYGQVQPEERDVIVDLPRTSDSDRRRALVHDHFKIIAYGDDTAFRVFDLDADPNEERSIEKTDRTTFAAMVSRYKAAQKAIEDVGPYACRSLKGAPPGRGY